jgi:hypothetical protein
MAKQRRLLKTPPEKLHELLKMQKIIDEEIIMELSADRTTASYRTRVVMDELMTTIPGLELKLISNRSPNGFVYHSFSLIFNVINHSDVFAQLEIEPSDKLSHRNEDGSEIYGAHWYIIGETTKVKDDESFDWYNWFKEFRVKTNLTIFGQCYQPFEGELI